MSLDALMTEITSRIGPDLELVLHRHKAEGVSPPLWVVQVGVPGRWEFVDIGPDASTALSNLLHSLEQAVIP